MQDRPKSRRSGHVAELAEWVRLVNESMQREGVSRRDLARQAGIQRNQLDRWLNEGAVPDGWALQSLATILQLPVRSQLIALGWLTARSEDDGSERSLVQVFRPDATTEFRQITLDLQRLQHRVETVARMPFALVRNVVEPPLDLDVSWRARWSARVHSRVAGVKYPTAYGMHVDFMLNPKMQPFVPQDLYTLLKGRVAFAQFLASNEQAFADSRPIDGSLGSRIAAERLELQALISAEPLAGFGVWVGHQGTSWRSLLPGLDPKRGYAHIFMSEEEQCSIPVGEDPHRIPRDDFAAIVIIGPSHQAGGRLGRLLAEGLGWSHHNVGQSAMESVGATAGTVWRADRLRQEVQTQFLSRLEAIRAGRLRQLVLSISQADVCVSQGLPETLGRMTNALTIVLKASERTADSYEALERDNCWLGVDVAPWNTSRFIMAATNRLISSLHDASGPVWVAPFDVGAVLSPPAIAEVDSRIADVLMIIAWSIRSHLRIAPASIRGPLERHADGLTTARDIVAIREL